MPHPLSDTEEHAMPCIEGLLACTLALMTGYSQSLQAAEHPLQRVRLGARIDASLAQLAACPQLSQGFRDVLASLQQRWSGMTECSAAGASLRRPETPGSSVFAAPERLQ
jgi:hypothetical protein